MLKKLGKTEFWISIIAALIPVLNKELGLQMNTETILTIIVPLISYTLSRGIAKINQK